MVRTRRSQRRNTGSTPVRAARDLQKPKILPGLAKAKPRAGDFVTPPWRGHNREMSLSQSGDMGSTPLGDEK